MDSRNGVLILCSLIAIFILGGLRGACGQSECTNGFVSLERLTDISRVSPRLQNQQLQIIPDLVFTCNGTITKWIAILAIPGSGDCIPDLQIWRSNGTNTYSRVRRTGTMEASVLPNLLYEITPDPPLEYKAGDILGILQPNSTISRFSVAFDTNTGPINYFARVASDTCIPTSNTFDITGSSIRQQNMTPLVALEIDSSRDTSQCIPSLIDVEKLAPIANFVRLRAFQTQQQQIFPHINFTCDGAITRWTIGALRNGDADLYPDLQIWRKTGNNTFTKVGNTTFVAPDFRPGVYEFSSDPPLPFQAGDVLGIFNPPQSQSRLSMYYERSGGLPAYFFPTSALQPPLMDSFVTTDTGVDMTNDLPLLTVEISAPEISAATSRTTIESTTPLPSVIGPSDSVQTTVIVAGTAAAAVVVFVILTLVAVVVLTFKVRGRKSRSEAISGSMTAKEMDQIRVSDQPVYEDVDTIEIEKNEAYCTNSEAIPTVRYKAYESHTNTIETERNEAYSTTSETIPTAQNVAYTPVEPSGQDRDQLVHEDADTIETERNEAYSTTRISDQPVYEDVDTIETEKNGAYITNSEAIPTVRYKAYESHTTTIETQRNEAYSTTRISDQPVYEDVDTIETEKNEAYITNSEAIPMVGNEAYESHTNTIETERNEAYSTTSETIPTAQNVAYTPVEPSGQDRDQLVHEDADTIETERNEAYSTTRISDQPVYEDVDTIETEKNGAYITNSEAIPTVRYKAYESHTTTIETQRNEAYSTTRISDQPVYEDIDTIETEKNEAYCTNSEAIPIVGNEAYESHTTTIETERNEAYSTTSETIPTAQNVAYTPVEPSGQDGEARNSDDQSEYAEPRV